MPLLLGLLLLSGNLLATSWNELTINRTYKVTQPFQLRQIERSQALLDINAGDKVYLSGISHMGMGVSLYTFDYLNCPGNMMATLMEIIPVQESSPVVEIGAQLKIYCRLEIYIETRNFWSQSIFK